MFQFIQTILPLSSSKKIASLLLRALFLFGLCFGATGCFESCQPPFPPRSQIEKFRILAIQADPPEVTPGNAVKVSFLAVDQNGLVKPDLFPPITSCFRDAGVADPSAIWVACLPGLDGGSTGLSACGQLPGFGVSGIDGGVIAADGGIPSGGGLPEGGTLPEQFQLFFPPCGPTSSWISPSDYLDPLPTDKQKAGSQALAVLATLFKGQRQISLKSILLSTRLSTEQNTNPRLTGMKVFGQSVTTCRPKAPEQCKATTVPALKKVDLSATLDPSRQDKLPPEKGKKERREDITITWFSTQGSFELRRTIRSGEDPPKHSPWPKWRPFDFKGQPLPVGQVVKIIAIARDSRGGVDWLSLTLRLGEPEKGHE